MTCYTGGFLRLSKSGKWVGVLKYRDPEGRWRQVTRTFTRDRTESELMLARWGVLMRRWPGGDSSGFAPAESLVVSGAAPTPNRAGMVVCRQGTEGDFPSGAAEALAGGLTVEAAVRSALDSQLARGRIERSTHDMQLAYCERDLFPVLGPVPITALTPAVVQAWVDSLCARMSPGSARVPYAVLSKTLAAAVRAGEIPTNPLALVDPPARVPPARASLPRRSAEALEAACASKWGPVSPLTCAVELALRAGLRAGECCGLRWRDVDLEPGQCRLRVSSSVARSSEGIYVKGPKNAASARSFPITGALAGFLGKRSRAVAGEQSPDSSWFVCGEREHPLDPRRLSCEFAKLCGLVGVFDDRGRRATFHALRHTFATEAVRAGVDVRTLADLLGHASAEVTLDVYAASGEDAKLAAVCRLESVERQGRSLSQFADLRTPSTSGISGKDCRAHEALEQGAPVFHGQEPSFRGPSAVG